MNNSKPVFITVDGIDGSGKSTIVKHICDEFTKQEKPFIMLSALKGGPAGKALYASCFTGNSKEEPSGDELALWVTTAHLETHRKVILPSIQNGISVILDRHIASFYAYQCCAFKNKIAQALYSSLLVPLLKTSTPDLNIHTYAKLSVLEERLNKRETKDFMEVKTPAFKHTVMKAYRDYYQYNRTSSGLNCFGLNTECEEILCMQLVSDQLKKLSIN